MKRTIPLAILEDGKVQSSATRRRRPAPRIVDGPTPETIARARELFHRLSPKAQAAVIRYITMLALDEAKKNPVSAAPNE